MLRWAKEHPKGIWIVAGKSYAPIEFPTYPSNNGVIVWDVTERGCYPGVNDVDLMVNGS